jgi:amino acid transporter
MTTGSRPPDVVTGDSQLVRALGTFGLAASIINITIGGGIFRLPADASSRVGAAAPLAYLVCALAMGIIVLCIADAASRVSMTGGPYAYIETAFGPFFGFLAGALLWLLSTFAMSAVSTVFAANAGALLPWFATPTGRAVFLIVLFAFFAAVNIRGVQQGARLNTIITVVKLAPLLLLAFGGLFAVQAEHVAITSLPATGDLARAVIVLVFAFAGIEAALVPSGEVRDPSRTVPRAIFMAMGGITVLYILLQFVARGVLGESLSTSATPLADAAGAAMGQWAATVLLLGASISMFGHAGGMMLAVSRMLFALGRDGFVPARLAAVHPSYRTPHVAIALQAIIATLLAVTSTFETLAILGNISVLLLYGGCCVAAWELRRRDVRLAGGTPFRAPLPSVLPWLGCAIILWMFTSITAREWLSIAAALAVMMVLYAVARWRATTAHP